MSGRGPDLALAIGPEQPSDAEPIERLHERAFGPGRFARTAFRLRESGLDAPELCFTALVGTLLVGSVRVSRIRAGREPALLLGPLAVEPAFEGRGIGGALVGAVLARAKGDGHRLVVLIGDEPYYRRFGFVRLPAGRLRPPNPVDPARLLAAELVPGALGEAEGRLAGDRTLPAG